MNENKNGQIRVLHILGGKMDLGGIEIFLMNYFRHVDRSKVTFDFLITEEGEGHFDSEIDALGGKLYNVVSKRINPIRHLLHVSGLLRQYRKNPVHFHLDGMNGLYSLVALISGCKIRISHSHNTAHLTTQPLKLLIHNILRITNRFTSNHFAASSNDAHYWLHGNQKIKYTWVPNAIDTNIFSYSPSLREFYRNRYNVNQTIVLGHVGRFHPQKNHLFMLEVAKELKRRDFRFKMMFVGEGHLRTEVENRIIKYELRDEVLLIGKLDNVHKIYNCFDAFLFPSKYEGLGIALVEAQYNNLACFTSDRTPMEATISDNVKVISLDVKSWVETIANHEYCDREESAMIIKNNSYSIQDSATILEKFYEGLV